MSSTSTHVYRRLITVRAHKRLSIMWLKTKEPICLCPASPQCSVSMFCWKPMSWHSQQFEPGPDFFAFSFLLAQFLHISLQPATHSSMRQVIIARAIRFYTIGSSPYSLRRGTEVPVQQRPTHLHRNPPFIWKPKDGLESPLYRSPPRLREATGNPYNLSIPNPLSYEIDYREPERLEFS